jgi:predicted GNAT family N-acyltransferase
MFVSNWIMGLQGADKALTLRRNVLVEEMGIGERDAFDWFDGIAAHLLIEDAGSGEAIACARMYPNGSATHIGRIAVAPRCRNLPYDELALRIMLDKAQRLAGEYIVAEAQAGQRALFEAFGFAANGEITPDENGWIRLSVAREAVVWPKHCQSGEM